MTSLKAAMTIVALAISAPALAMSKPDPQHAGGLPSGGHPSPSSSGGSTSGGGVVDVSSPSALLLLGLAAGGLILGRRGRK